LLRLVTYHTPSHEAMCKEFVIDRAYWFADITNHAAPQTCPSGSFKTAGWNACMEDKLKCLLDVPTDNEPTVYVDADVVLLPGFHEWCRTVFKTLPSNGVMFGDDVIQWCAGVMLFRANNVTREWWKLLLELSRIWCLPDQDVIHQLRAQASQTGGTLPIQAFVAPHDVIANWATVNMPAVPSPWAGEQFLVPPTCLAWHANWTVGIENKTAMLRRVVDGREHKSS